MQHGAKCAVSLDDTTYIFTLHAQVYCLSRPTFSLLLVLMSHFVLEVFAAQLLLSRIVSPLMSVLA